MLCLKVLDQTLGVPDAFVARQLALEIGPNLIVHHTAPSRVNALFERVQSACLVRTNRLPDAVSAHDPKLLNLEGGVTLPSMPESTISLPFTGQRVSENQQRSQSGGIFLGKLGVKASDYPVYTR